MKDVFTMKAREMLRFDDIQSARFFAAAIVMLGHLLIFSSQTYTVSTDLVAFMSWFGGPAVYLFFSISGFVISHSAQSQTALEFIKIRLFRIYFGFFLAVIVVLSIKFSLSGSVPANEVSVKALTLLPFGTIGYPLWIEWSLVFEVIFYLLFAVVWIARSNKLVTALSIGWAAMIVIVNMRLSPSLDRLNTFPQILVSLHNLPFIAGVLAYQLRSRIHPRWKPWLIVFALNLTALSVFPRFGAVFNTMALGISCGSIVLALALRRSGEDSAGSGPIGRLTAYLGDSSYGIYLIHTACITIALSRIGPGAASAGAVVISVGILSLTIAAVFGLIERGLYNVTRKKLFR